MSTRYSCVIFLTLCTILFPFGCSKSAAPISETKPKEPVDIAPQSYEAGAAELLAARLPLKEAAQGWIRLFDGHTLYGWEIAGGANWRVENGSVVVDSGQPCLLCTSVPWQNYELTFQYKAPPQTNSGVFLRTPLDPQDSETDCYEVNIAPLDNPFPTGGIVKRQKANSEVVATGDWQTMNILLDGGEIKISVDDKLVCEFEDSPPIPDGRIGLQYNKGRIEFREIKLRPLGLESLLDEELTKWIKYPKMPGEFTVTEDGSLRVKGGRSQLESKESYGDFVLLAQYKLPTAEMNSGIFFRCIPGKEMMGYECQLSNEFIDGNALAPVDCGTGGFFRRQDARIVAGEVDKWATVMLVARDHNFAAWVNGLQVTNWYDDRESDANPRKGFRLAPGSIMIQGHDPGTDALLKQIKVAAVQKGN